MMKRTIGIVLAAGAGAAVVAAVLYFSLHGRISGPPSHEEAKNDPNDNAAPQEEPDDPSLYKPAPVSLSSAVSGRNSVQRWRAAVLRGRVTTAEGKGLEKVKVGVTAQAQASQTLTDADGDFDFAVNGGGPLVVVCEKTGFLPVRRQVAAPWQDYAWLPDVVLVPAPARAGVLDLPWRATADGAAPVVRGEPVADDVPRQATFLAPPGFTAGGVKGKLSLSVREYGAGPRGASALPAPRPPGTGFAYAVELAADEARQPGARGLVFNPSLVHYVENFLRLPVGTELPTWRYDAEQSLWLPGPAGRVVRVGDFTKGLDEKPPATDGEKKETEPSTAGPSTEEQKCCASCTPTTRRSGACP